VVQTSIRLTKRADTGLGTGTRPGQVFAKLGTSSRSQLDRVLQAAIPATLAGIAGFHRDAVTSCQTPPFRLRLLPLAWPGAVSAM
jgi:hypothetical protein